MSACKQSPYRGRLAPSPTGYLHLGHARTFWTAQQRARDAHGALILRVEDLDRARCAPHFVSAMFEDLKWFGFQWQEGPDIGGQSAPYTQSERVQAYRVALERLKQNEAVYPCTCSRQDVLRAIGAPHQGDDEPIYPGTCRPRRQESKAHQLVASSFGTSQPARVNWRFRVPDGETIQFIDGRYGVQTLIAGKDFGDFIVWRHDDVPAYHLAVVVDDSSMNITEVVRGADLLKSTARQLLLYRALGWSPPQFYHCPVVTDEHGVRLAKRNDALSLRTLRAAGADPSALRKGWSE